jgi:hypothetical protein
MFPEVGERNNMSSSDTSRVWANNRVECYSDILRRAPDTDEQEFLSPEYPSQLRAEYVREFFAEAPVVPPQPVSRETRKPVDPPACNKRDGDAFEDYLCEIIDGWTEEERATVYWYLHASGMSLHKALSIRRKAGLTP